MVHHMETGVSAALAHCWQHVLLELLYVVPWYHGIGVNQVYSCTYKHRVTSVLGRVLRCLWWST